ncbi:8-amino-7-oxononanoate synthase [Formivibrio citricus]|uniref:8-amino-7-oxononanoate synthase n=2 Tax=Formivibrio citricus TaxID=83765 RepID=A0A1I4Z611_9NEIS|nr:8-amino-7-oxononanoate synthase [Formivibrio citricus]
MKYLDEIRKNLAERREQGLFRQRSELETLQGAHIRVDGKEYINFSSNDYLGLSSNPELIATARAAAAHWGVGSGASHLVCGHFSAHENFERDFARFVGKPAALSFSTGYMANLGVISALAGRGDAVFADKLNHASLNDACVLSRAEFKRYPHNDMAALERLLSASTASHKLIVSDTIFSMDGDIAPLKELLALAERYDALLYLDDAHGFGVLGNGRGALAEFGLSSPRLIYLATLGKAAGVSGAAVAAELDIIDWLINAARSYIYTTAAPPLLAETLSKSLELIAEENWRREHLQRLVALFREGLSDHAARLMESSTPIQPVLVETNAQALRMSAALKEAGFWIAAIRPPTVPTPRLRVTLTAAHSEDDVKNLAACLRKLLEEAA